MRLVGWFGFALVAGCFGTTDGETRQPPEICDDGIDNDNDGFADCDDRDSCGGLACRGTTTYVIDTAANLPIADVVFSAATCCDFEFGPSDCPQKEIGTIQFFNRASEDEGEVDVSCDLVDTESPVQWKVDGASAPVPFVTNANVFAGETVTVTGYFVCAAGVNQLFTTKCRANVEVGTDRDEIEFDVTGTPSQ
jgi:hypothetical protein